MQTPEVKMAGRFVGGPDGVEYIPSEEQLALDRLRALRGVYPERVALAAFVGAEVTSVFVAGNDPTVNTTAPGYRLEMPI